MGPSSYKTALIVVIHTATLPLQIAVFFIFFLYNQMVLFLARFQNVEKLIPGSSSMFCADDLFRKPSSSIIMALELTGDFSLEETLATFQKVYDIRDASTGERCFKEMGYSIASFLGYNFWKRFPDFQIAKRVYVLQEPENLWNNSSLISFVQNLQRKPFTENEPLWDVHILPNYNGHPSSTMMVIRTHHTLADGLSLMQFLHALTGTYRPATEKRQWRQGPEVNILGKIYSFFNLLIYGWADYTWQCFIDKDRSALTHHPNGQRKSPGSWICTQGRQLSVDRLKRASKLRGCGIVHFVVAGVSGGLEKYGKKYHSNEDGSFPNGVYSVAPMPLPNHPVLRFVNYLYEEICLIKMFLKWGNGGNTTKQLEGCKEEIEKCATATFPTVSAIFINYAVGLIPTALFARLGVNLKGLAALVVSNVVGTHEGDERTIAGMKLADLIFWMPLAAEAPGISAGVLSFNGSLRVCLTADDGCVPNHSRLTELNGMIEQEIERFCDVLD